MLHKKSFSLLLVLALAMPTINAQEWVTKMQDPSVNFYDVQQSFNNYWKKEERKEKFKTFFSLRKQTEKENDGYMLYKRWEAYTEPRVYPSGDRSLIQQGNEVMRDLMTSPAAKSNRQSAGNWQPLGAFAVPDNGGGAGRLNCVRFHPTNHNIIYVGAPSGGFWKTTNNGVTWTTSTDLLPTIGVSDIAVDPVNTNVIYIATGDADASDSYGVGVLKSTDGGQTWNITGLSSAPIQMRKVNRVLVNPTNHNMVIAGATNGIFKSIDAGATWTRVSQLTSIRDLEFKPGNSNIVYAVASSKSILRSTDAGNTFVAVAAGLPTASAVERVALAVTPANPSVVYAVYSKSSTSGFYGLYRSTDSGLTFTQMSNAPNLIGYDWDGQDTGGAGWYTLSIAASPFNADDIVVGGVNIWQSQDAGVSWSIVAHWYGDHNLPYVHADIHDLIFAYDGAIYAGCDGGIFKSNDDGASWTDKSDGMQIGEMYCLGTSATDPGKVVQGWQDNGCSMYDSGTWTRILGGDGMECFIDWSDPNYVYAEFQNGAIRASTDGGANFNDISGGITESGSWVTPWCQDPINSQTIYAAYSNMWKSTDRGNTWNTISSFNSSGLTTLAVAKSNHNYIYSSVGNVIHKTANGGTTWTQFSIPGNNGSISYIAVSNTNPNIVWATVSGYNVGCKVYKSTDGGTTWTNLSLNLPNIPINCVVNQTGTADGVYIGTELGCYYFDNTRSSWMPFSNGLPNVVVDELEIQYSSNKLRAATFGRGLWETNIFNPASNTPYANFTADTLSGCPGFTAHFYDSTLHSPTSWLWRFPGGTPATSALQNPVVTYNTPGMYHNVTLVATNAIGTDSVTKLSYIAVSPNVQPTISFTGNDTICTGQHVTLVSSFANTFLWSPSSQANQQLIVTHTGAYSVTTTDIFNCTNTSAPVNIVVLQSPPTPTITLVGDTLFSSSPTNNQWYVNGNLSVGDTNQYYLITTGGNTYKVVVYDSLGFCFTSSSNFVGITELANIGIDFSLFPNPASGSSVLVLQSSTMDDVSVEITDVVGKTMYRKEFPQLIGRVETNIDLTVMAKGIYFLSIRNSKGKATQKLVVSK